MIGLSRRTNQITNLPDKLIDEFACKVNTRVPVRARARQLEEGTTSVRSQQTLILFNDYKMLNDVIADHLRNEMKS